MAFAICGKLDIQLSVSKLPIAVYLIFHARLNANMKKRLLSLKGTKAIIYFCGTTQIDAHASTLHTYYHMHPIDNGQVPVGIYSEKSFQTTLVSPFNYRPPAVSHHHSSL